MSVKTETIEVRRCDFCISTAEARTCQHCDKDACANCARIYRLVSEYWTPTFVVSTSSFGGQSTTFSAFVCHDCAQNELPTIMLRFGFSEAASKHAHTA